MHAVNHAAVGAGIALAVKQPVLALPLAFVSHYALDALPHYGIRGDEGYRSLFRYRRTYLMVAVDVLGLLALAAIIRNQAWYVAAAAVAALLPDIAWPYRYFLFERKGVKPQRGLLTDFHNNIQWGERLWGIFIEIPLALLLIAGISQLV